MTGFSDESGLLSATTYYLTVNLKTAASLGLTISPALLARTNELIQ